MKDSKIDDMKGRAKEAIGALTDDERLQREGENDQRAGKAKDAIERVGDKAKDVVDDVRKRARD